MQKVFVYWINPTTDKIITSRDVKFLNEHDDIQYINTETTENSDVRPRKNQSETEVILPSTIEEEPQTSDHSDDERTDHSDDEGTDVSDEENQDHTLLKRGPGRLRIIRTGLRGRPKKDYNMVNTIQETSMFTEVPVREAISGSTMDEWYTAMAIELKSIVKNNAWKLVNHPNNKNVVGSRVVLTNKYQSDGCLQKRKARIVARGFSQRPGVDFHESFAPVARLSSIRLVTAIAAHYKMYIHQCDITTAYLNSPIKEEIYMEVPEQLEETLEKLISIENNKSNIRSKAVEMLKELRTGDKVCRLQKALYGLKQAGREWYTSFVLIYRFCFLF